MKKIGGFVLVLISSLFFLFCNDPVFYTISTQVAILPPRIPGSPTDFAEISGIMYVASGNNIYYFNTATEEWNAVNPGIGKITYIAAGGGSLYALTKDNVYKSASLNPPIFSSPFTTADSYWFTSMYSADNKIFVGARKNNSYYILQESGTSLTELAATGDNELNGAAYSGGTYFLSAKNQKDSGGCIYTGAGAVVSGSENISFMGIANIGSATIAITNSGQLYTVTAGTVTQSEHLGKLSNGTLYYDSAKGILLAGRVDSKQYDSNTGFTYGYMEAEVSGTSIVSGFREPGITAPSTLLTGTGYNDRFKTTIGKYPVKYMYRTSTGLLFASTQQNGVWSLRDRDNNGSPYWNTEN